MWEMGCSSCILALPLWWNDTSYKDAVHMYFDQRCWWNDQSCAINEFPSTFESCYFSLAYIPSSKTFILFAVSSIWQNNSRIYKVVISFLRYENGVLSQYPKCQLRFFSIWNWRQKSLSSIGITFCCRTTITMLFVLLHNYKINEKLVYKRA